MIKLEGRKSSYSWRWNMAIKADVVGAKLEEIQEEHGEVTPKLVLDNARSEKSELHSLFIWDDSIAGEKYRLNQAAYILRNLRINYVKSEKNSDTEPQIRQVRAFLNVQQAQEDDEESDGSPQDQRRVYLSSTVAFRSPQHRDYILTTARAELEAWRNRYAALKEFDGVIREIDKALRAMTNEVKAAA